MSKQQQDPNEDGEATRRPNVRSGGRILRAAVGLVAAVTLGVGLAVAPTPAVVTPKAEAHNGVLTPTPKCVDGKTEILWTGTTSNVPAGVTATVNIIDFEPAGSTFSAINPDPVQPNGSFSFTQTVPGDATFAQAVAHIRWSNGVVDDPIGRVNLPGDCDNTPPDDGDTKKIAFCHATGSATNPYVFIETSVNAFYQAGHINHADDIWPAFSYVKNGQTINVPAQGDQSLLATGCVKPPTDTEVTPAAPTASTPDCTNPNMTVTPGSQPGVIWNPSGATTLTPGQSVTYTAAPADTYTFPTGQQTSWSYTNDFKVEDCVTKVVPVAPAVTTASCEQPNIMVTAADQLGVLWNHELPYLLAPGESVTLVASPAQGFAFPADALTSWPFTNDFNVEDCEETPPNVGYAGTVSGDCTYGYGSASIDKNYDGRVKFTLWVGDDSKSFWVRPGDSGGAKLKGEPGDRVRLMAEGKNIAIGHMKKNCDTPTPECKKDCGPPPSYECPTGEYWFDSNGNGMVEPRECKPAGPVDAGLGSSAPVSGGSSSGSGGGEQPNNGQRVLTGPVAVLERRPRVRRR